MEMMRLHDRQEVIEAILPDFYRLYQNVQGSYGSKMTNITPPNIHFRFYDTSFVLNAEPRRLSLVNYPSSVGRILVGAYEYNDPDFLVKIHDAVKRYH
jgi:hypothetical protein